MNSFDTEEDDKKFQDMHIASFRRLPVTMRERCVEAIRSWFEVQDEEEVSYIKKMIRDNPYTWWAEYHHNWGMHMRNFLRDYYMDDQLPPAPYDDDGGEYQNWDDYYVGILEVAFKQGIYHLLDESERV